MDQIAVIVDDLLDDVRLSAIDIALSRVIKRDNWTRYDSIEMVPASVGKVICIGSVKIPLKLRNSFKFVKMPFTFDLTRENMAIFCEKLDSAMSTKKLVQYEIVDNIQRVFEVFEYCKNAGVFAFDFETEGLDWMNDKPTVLSLTFQAGYSYVIPIYHFEFTWSPQDLSAILQAFCELMQHPDTTKIGHNVKFDLHVYRTFFKGSYKGRIVDTLLQHHTLDENSLQDLEVVSTKFFPETAGYSITPPDWSRVPLQELAEYAAIDTNNTFKLFVLFEDELTKDSELYHNYRNIQIPTLRALENAEFEGALIDRKYIEKSIDYAMGVAAEIEQDLRSFKELKRFESHMTEVQTAAEIARIEAKARKTAIDIAKLDKLRSEPEPFVINFASPKQLGELFYTPEGFNFPKPYDKKKKMAVMSTAEEHLMNIDSPFVEFLQAYRSVHKIIATYYTGILQRLDNNDRVHTTFKQHGTVTGRLSSSNPNLQNLVSRTKFEKLAEVVRRVKEFFIAPPGLDLIQADLSQAELRCIASVADDPTMIRAYNSGVDLHTSTGARLANMTLDEFKTLEDSERKHFRQIAKSANFGYVYGSTIEGYIDYVQKETGNKITKEVAEEHRDALFGTYTELTRWHNQYIQLAKANGFVRTLFGRKRTLLDINSSDDRLSSKAERQAVNSPIQGTSGEWCNLILSLCHMILPKYALFFNTVHDAIYMYCPPDKTATIIEHILSFSKRLPLDDIFDMSRFKVDMELDFEVAQDNWANVQKYKLHG